MSNILEKLRQVEAENERIRAALAVSKDPCVYCSLPAEEWAKCAQGFPGCARSDDAMGCPELGAATALREAEARVKVLEEALRQAADARMPGEARRIARAALASKEEGGR